MVMQLALGKQLITIGGQKNQQKTHALPKIERNMR